MYHTMFEDEETGRTIVVDLGLEGGWIAKVINSEEDAQAFGSYDQACDWARENL